MLRHRYSSKRWQPFYLEHVVSAGVLGRRLSTSHRSTYKQNKWNGYFVNNVYEVLTLGCICAKYLIFNSVYVRLFYFEAVSNTNYIQCNMPICTMKHLTQ